MPIPLPTLKVLDAISVPTHCPVPWEGMEGTSQTRFCTKCSHPVHDVSELTTEEALALLRGPGRPPCLRIYRRADGRVLTADCTTKRERVWKWLRRRCAWVGSVFAGWFLSGCQHATQGMAPAEYGEVTKITVKPTESSESPAP
jgi:hypothetical protein